MRLTMRDIARMTGTSPTAVSFVLNGKDRKRVRAEKRDAILAVVQKHGYRPSSAAKALTLRRAFRIALCTTGGLDERPVVGDTSHYEVLATAEQRLYDAEYSVAMLRLDTRQPLPEIARRLSREEVDGFLLVDFAPDVLDKILFSLAEHDLPAVSVGTARPASDDQSSWAAIDREGSFAHGTTHLLDQGLTRLVMIEDCRPGPYAAARRRGYEGAMRARGLEPSPTVAMKGRTARAASEATEHVLAEDPDVQGVLLADNLFAPVVQMALAGSGAAIMGFGDSVYAQFCDPPIPYLRLPVRELAETCIDHLLAWIERPEEHVAMRKSLPCELVGA